MRKRTYATAALVGVLLALAAVGCAPAPAAASFDLSSPAFGAGQPIPRVYTCEGGLQSPPLAWGEPPTGTQSFALIVDDPDAPMGTYVHWVLYNIPASARQLPAGVPAGAELPDGSRQGKGSNGKTSYFGPCPPSGTHRYFFKLYALDGVLNLEAGATKAQLLAAMKKHILGQAELMGTYQGGQ